MLGRTLHGREMGRNGNQRGLWRVYWMQPQGSSVSPILSLIYIADLPQAIGNAEEKMSFVDDVRSVPTGVNVDEVMDKLERCAERALD
jgi:hypothetical protein